MPTAGADVYFGSASELELRWDMTTDTPAKPKRETWLDWQPARLPEPREMLTREQFVERANAIGVNVTERDLRYWEHESIIPHGLKRWSEGANRIYLPRWALYTITLLRGLQDIGMPLKEIAPHLRLSAQDAIETVFLIDELGDHPYADTSGTKKGGNILRLDAHRAAGDNFLRLDAQRAARKQFLRAVDQRMVVLAGSYMALTDPDQDVAAMKVIFYDNEGNVLDDYHLDFRQYVAEQGWTRENGSDTT